MEQENIEYLEPMDRLGVDPFKIGNVDYLAIVDRSSSYVKCYLLKDKTFNSVRKALVDFFLMYGRAHKIRTDGGPCFLKQFATWADNMGILLETSSPRTPASNGLGKVSKTTVFFYYVNFNNCRTPPLFMEIPVFFRDHMFFGVLVISAVSTWIFMLLKVKLVYYMSTGNLYMYS